MKDQYLPLTATQEDYLAAIFCLACTSGETRSNAIAGELGGTRSTVPTALKGLNYHFRLDLKKNFTIFSQFYK